MEASVELVVETLLHPLFPLWLRLRARCLSQPREVVARPLRVGFAIKQVAVGFDDRIACGSCLAVEGLKRSWVVERSKADARASGWRLCEFVCEGDQVTCLLAAVLQPEAHGHSLSRSSWAFSAVGLR